MSFCAKPRTIIAIVNRKQALKSALGQDNYIEIRPRDSSVATPSRHLNVTRPEPRTAFIGDEASIGDEAFLLEFQHRECECGHSTGSTRAFQRDGLRGASLLACAARLCKPMC
mmetsp:Transcript_90178/g.131984  ORF Transcript_90178/g.131984 Transcript_90178/m.131984 type:complete len:113 (+) Transcript_90178:117-455(+)